MCLTTAQRKALEFLWLFKYGNSGMFYTPQNHKYLGLCVDGKYAEAEKMLPLVSQQCKAACDRVLQNDFRELTKSQRKFITDILAMEEFYQKQTNQQGDVKNETGQSENR